MADNHSASTRRTVCKRVGTALSAGLLFGSASSGAGASSDGGPTAVMHGDDRVTREQTVTFTGTDSYDDDGEIVSYDWEFDMYSDDGGYTASKSGEVVEHQFYYGTDEERTAKLTVTDDQGNTDTVTHQIMVYRNEDGCNSYGCSTGGSF